MLASVEVDPIHAAVHHHHFPASTAICRSVVLLSGAQIRAARKPRGEAVNPDDLSHPRRWNPRLLKANTRTAHTELSRA